MVDNLNIDNLNIDNLNIDNLNIDTFIFIIKKYVNYHTFNHNYIDIYINL